MQRDLTKGDIPILILAVLSNGRSHGYAIARDIEQQSGQSLRLREGSLYPALRVLEQEGLIASEWETQPSGPARKVYGLTASGRKALEQRARSWRQYVSTMDAILGGIGHARKA